MGYDLDEPFEVRLIEDNDPDRPCSYIYAGLLESDLFNADEKMLIIYLISFSYDSEADRINTIAISINRLIQKLGMGRAIICRHIKLLEQKGVLVKKSPASEDNDDFDNIYGVLNYISVWDCKTLDELKKETDRIKREVQWDG